MPHGKHSARTRRGAPPPKPIIAKLAAADTRWTDEEREQQRIAFLRRLDAA
jgi:hypothetical protein